MLLLRPKSRKRPAREGQDCQFPFTVSMPSFLTYVTVSTVIFMKGLGHIKAVIFISKDSEKIIIILPCLLFYKIFLICIALLTVKMISKSLSVTFAVI
jgi:cellulose synthase/poly-beta-1,6-N-acetylglucosamine synthase-like glycosyltransferase